MITVDLKEENGEGMQEIVLQLVFVVVIAVEHKKINNVIEIKRILEKVFAFIVRMIKIVSMQVHVSISLNSIAPSNSENIKGY